MENLIENLKGRKIGVIGDLMLDVFIEGESSRISPEAPVPIVNFIGETLMPGGAANIAANIKSLGGQAVIFGIIGNDVGGEQLLKQLSDCGLATDFITTENQRITTKKTRILSSNHHIVRIDREEIMPPLAETELRHIDLIKKEMANWEAIIIADYGKGYLTQKMAEEIINKALLVSLPVIVDAKPQHVNWYKNCTLIKPNKEEALSISQTSNINEAGKIIQKNLQSNVLITLGREGMVLFHEDQIRAWPSFAKEIVDVSGCGDTVIAACALALSVKASLADAAFIANTAAGIAVGKIGTSTVSFQELEKAIKNTSRPFIVSTKEELLDCVKKARRRGEKIVMTNGCFDILHVGHIKILREAKALGDRLIVALNSDHSVKRLKGKTRPINSQEKRAEILAALKFVDWVTIFNEDTPEELIKSVSPDFLVKGGDYKVEDIAGSDHVKKTGGKIVLIPLALEESSTKIIEILKNNLE